MSVCPKCFADSVSGHYCGVCGARVDAVLSVPNRHSKDSMLLQEQATMPKISAHDIKVLEQQLKERPTVIDNYLNLIVAQIEIGRYEQAFSTFRAARTIAPDHIQMLNVGAKVLELMGRGEEAIQYLKASLKIKYGNVDVAFRLASLLNDCGKKYEAVEILEELYESTHSNPDVVIRLAQAHLNLGNASEAQKYLGIYKEMAGNTHEMYLLLGQTMLARHFFDGAVKNFREAIKTFPEDSQMRLGLGRAYLGMNEKGQALLEFEQALQKNTNNIEILIELGKLQSFMGMVDQANNTFDRVEKDKKVSGDNFLAIAVHFMEQGNLQRSVEYLTYAHKLSPYHPEIQKNLGHTLVRQKKFAQAFGIYKEAIDLYPECQWGHEGIVACAAASNDFELKATSQKALLRLKKSDAEAWCDYGETLIRLGQFDESKDAFESAAKIDPACIRAYQAPELIKSEKARSEGEKLADQGREALQEQFFLTAAERLEKALKLVPNHPEWTNLLAKVFLETAEVAKASGLLAQVYSSSPGNYEASMSLAKVYEFENKTKLAIELLTSITKEHPTEIEAHIMLIRIKRGQIRSIRVETEMLNPFIRNLGLELAHLQKSSPIPRLVKGYAWYIFSFGSKLQKEGFANAEKAFLEVLADYSDNEYAVKGLSLVERARNNVEKAVEYTRTLVKLSSDPHKSYILGRLYENFQRHSEALECYSSLCSLFPENALYRRKKIEMLAELSGNGGKNLLLNMLSEYQQAIHSKSDPWILFEIALIQEQFTDSNIQKDEWVKKSLLSWHKALNHPHSNYWMKWEMLKCQFKHITGSERQRIISANLKACEKILREMPNRYEAFLAISRCYLAYADLISIDRALGFLEKSWFLSGKDIEVAIMLARTAKKLGKSVIVDAIGYNVIILEPELATTVFKL